MNGLSILQSYVEKDCELDITYGGFCQLSTVEVQLTTRVSNEDHKILKDIGWTYEGFRKWKFEEWS